MKNSSLFHTLTENVHIYSDYLTYVILEFLKIKLIYLTRSRWVWFSNPVLIQYL